MHQFVAMGADTTHVDFDRLSPVWQRLRDFLEGERRVKSQGELYLPRLSGQSDTEFTAYRDRGKFLNATARTHQALVGMIFRKDPVYEIGSALTSAIEDDCDMAGGSLYQYIRTVVSEVLAVGRSGTLVDWHDGEGRPYFAHYSTENVINWRYERRNGRWMLALVVLKEISEQVSSDDDFVTTEVPQYRVLKLDDSGKYVVEVWQPDPQASDGKGTVDSNPNVKNIAKGNVQLIKTEEKTPLKAGLPINRIPWVWHLPDPADTVIGKPPLDDLVALHETHYRLSRDHYHGLHHVALPTPWVAGFETGSQLKIGSSVAWVTDNVQAKAGMLEFTGAGLGAIKDELTDLVQDMAVMGARLLEPQKREAETAEALQIRAGGDASVLTAIATSVGVSVEKVLRWAEWFMTRSGEEPEELKKITLELNTDFTTARLNSDEVQKLVAAYISRGISFETLFFNLQRGEVIEPGRTIEEELESIKKEDPGMMDLGGDEETQAGAQNSQSAAMSNEDRVEDDSDASLAAGGGE